MSLRSCVLIMGTIGLFFSSVYGIEAVAGQDANNQGQVIMTPVNGPNVTLINGSTESKESLVGRLHLLMYEAAAGDGSMCGQDMTCAKYVKGMKSVLCAAALCNGTENARSAISCFEADSSKLSVQEREGLDPFICPMIKSPNTQTRHALLEHLPKDKKIVNYESVLVEQQADYMALKGSATKCEDFIKDYVGAYGPHWQSRWYMAMSGCRILSGETTRKQEEKDFYTWFGVIQGLGKCSDIKNSEMRKACKAPGAASPTPYLW